MEQVDQEQPSMKVLNLEGKLTIEQIKKIKQEMLDAINSHDKVWLNLTRTSAIDISGIQLLYGARRYANKKGKELLFTGTIPEPVTRSLLTGGFLRTAVSEGNELATGLIDFPESEHKIGEKDN